MSPTTSPRLFIIILTVAFASLCGNAGLAQGTAAPAAPPSSIAESPAFGGDGGAATAPTSYRLIGTIEGKSFIGAVLDDPSGMQTFYRLGEKLPDGSQIVKVESDSISLKGPDGSPYELYINHDMAKTSGGPPVSSASYARPMPVPQAPVARPAMQGGGGPRSFSPGDMAAMREARMKEREQMREKRGDKHGARASDMNSGEGGGWQRRGRPGMQRQD